MLFPGQGARTAAHNLRQLLYRVRRLGAAVEADEHEVMLAAGDVTDDFTALCDGVSIESEAAKAVAGGVLPGYAPTFSRPFGRWVETQRTRIGHDLNRVLVAQLSNLRSGGRWRDLEPIASACLALDPLNEEATLALAESLALNGQKARAVQLLDAYIEEIGPYGADLRIPAHVLRTRISEHVPAPRYRRLGPGPFVGRDAEMAELWRHYQHAKRGAPRTVVIHGEPGIGKTRLATEFLKAAALDGATCVKVECAPHDVRRPLGVFVDLVPKLLEAPGGLGVAPEAMEDLRRLTQRTAAPTLQIDLIDVEAAFQSIRRSLADLLEAVASEVPLVIVVDNADWMDPASTDVFGTTLYSSTSQPILLLFTSRSKSTGPDADSLLVHAVWLRAGPLRPAAATTLIGALLRQVGRTSAPAASANCVHTARGNPLFLRALAADVASPDGALTGASSLGDALSFRVRQLSDNSLRAFVACAILGRYVSPSRIADVSGVSPEDLIPCMHTLEGLGFIGGDFDDHTSAHPLLSQAALSEVPALTRQLMHASAAASLACIGGTETDTAILWESAEHWAQAGEPSKAVELLQSCAEHCLQIGQPVVGCDLLRRASTLDQGSRRLTILERLIYAARLAGDHILTQEAITLHRRSSSVGSREVPHDDFELFELEALRLNGGSAVDFIPRYSKCLTSTRADAHHRLMAATNLMIAYDLALLPSAASNAYMQASDIAASTPQLRADRQNLDLFYNCLIGNPETGLVVAATMWDQLGRSVPSWRDVPRVSNVGTAMFRCGLPHEGISVLREAFLVATRAGIHSHTINLASMLSWMCWIVGDLQGRDEWDRVANDLFDSKSDRFERTSHYLSNKIEYAIEAHDCDAARTWLALAQEKYGEITAPRIRMVSWAFELRIQQIEGRTEIPSNLIPGLEKAHLRGKSCGLHDNFAEAYWHALSAVDSRIAADAMLNEYIHIARRDRFPVSPAIRLLASSANADPTQCG
ncbi:MAG TPA: AAA family ATPase [Gemmatimonadaceae bacterium]|nr:AAA family ATPase [Gemmatimonadaceae bacterium]